jgi:hypothetical protein
MKNVVTILFMIMAFYFIPGSAAELILFNRTPYTVDGEVHVQGSGCKGNFGFRLEGYKPAQDPDYDWAPNVRFSIPNECSPTKVRSSIVGEIPKGTRPIKPKGQHAKEWPGTSGDSWSGRQKIISLEEAPEAAAYNTEWVVAGQR